MERFVKCNGCGHTGPEFPKGRDFFQYPFIAGCPKCDNGQSPGGASMRMGGGPRPFVYVDRPSEPSAAIDPLATTLHRAGEAS